MTRKLKNKSVVKVTSGNFQIEDFGGAGLIKFPFNNNLFSVDMKNYDHFDFGAFCDYLKSEKICNEQVKKILKSRLNLLEKGILKVSKFNKDEYIDFKADLYKENKGTIEAFPVHIKKKYRPWMVNFQRNYIEDYGSDEEVEICTPSNCIADIHKYKGEFSKGERAYSFNFTGKHTEDMIDIVFDKKWTNYKTVRERIIHHFN